MPNERDACNEDVAPDHISSLGLSPVPRLHLHLGSGNMLAGMSAKRFRIAFSFAGEKRDCVAKRFSKEAIPHDKYHKAEFVRVVHAGLPSS
ncbi:MAG: hypothetical protein HZA88_00410 [Verrucomicrobia bacterium]|nr:hypothetical protein [Verrucomicrobiota bacterium]